MADELGTLVAKLGADLTDLKRGLLEGKAQLAGFQQVVEDAGAKVRQVLAFAGVGVGIYELVSKLKEFGREILDIGAKNEVLRASMYAIGQHYKISGDALDLYINKLTQMGLSQENALQSVNNFLKAGLSVDLLPQLAAAAKDLAPTMAMPFNEAYQTIIDSVVKGTPKDLAKMIPPLKQALLAASSETKKMLDSTILSGTEKAMIMIDLALQAAAKVKGAGDAVAGSYMAKLAEYKRVALEAKEALFEFLKPVTAAALGAQITSWHELNLWVVNNRLSLVQLSEILVVYIEKGVLSTKMIIEFVAAHKDLLLFLLEVKATLMGMAVLSGVVAVLLPLIQFFQGLKIAMVAATASAGVFAGVAGMAGVAPAAASASVAVGGLIGRLAALRLALAGPWGLVIAVTMIALYEGAKAINAVVKKTPSVGTAMAMGGAEYALPAEQRDELQTRGQAEDAAAAEQRAFEDRLKEADAKISRMTPSEQTRKGPGVTEAEAKAEVDRARKLGELENALGAGGKKGGKGAKETTDNLLAPMLAMYKARREVELAEAQNSLDLLKTTNEKKKSELEKSLAEGLIDGKAYYQGLQDLQELETAAALEMIEKKKQAQVKAYQESLSEVDADQKLSDEAKSIARQKLEADNRKSLAKLDTEAAQARLDGEKRITDELKRQVEVRKQYQQKTEDLNLETNQLLGAITEQEAKLQRLVLDWQRAKQEAIDKGAYTPAVAAAMDANLGAKQFDVKYGETLRTTSSEFAAGVTNIINGIRQGTLDIGKTLTDMFNNIMMATLKPGFDALGTALTSAVKWLLSSLSTSLGGPALPGTSGYDYQPGGYGFKNWAHGGAFSHGVRLAFAGGGIVTRPTLFPMATGQGLMGEAGAEGILPLTRIGGDLGVKALFPQAAATPVNVIVNNNAPRTQALAEQQGNGDIVVTIDELAGKAYARRGTLYKLINQGDKAIWR